MEGAMEGTSDGCKLGWLDGCKLVLGALDSEGTKLGCRKKGERKVEYYVKREEHCAQEHCQSQTTYRSTCAGTGRF